MDINVVSGASMTSSFRDRRVWQEAMKLASEIYRVTANFPKHGLYGLSQQATSSRLGT